MASVVQSLFRLVALLLRSGMSVVAIVKRVVMNMDFGELLERDSSGELAISAIRSGYPVNRPLAGGSTPLLIAATFGLGHVVDVLIENHAVVSIPGRGGMRQTPLHAAAQGGWVRICESLIAAGAHASSDDANRATPLHYAASMGFFRTCEVLLNNGALASAKNRPHGATPLMLAVAGASRGADSAVLWEVGNLLFSEGFSTEGRDEQDFIATVRLLLSQGVGRREVSKAAVVAKVHDSLEMQNFLTFFGASKGGSMSIRWTSRAHRKRLLESKLGRDLATAFRDSGVNDGTPRGLRAAADLFEDFLLAMGAPGGAAESEANRLAEWTALSRYPNLFNVALDYALHQYESSELSRIYHSDTTTVLELGCYVDALFPDFIGTRPRVAGGVGDLREFQARLYVLVDSVCRYIGRV